ncbi:MAG: CidA/LrgA family protein [bacterium]
MKILKIIMGLGVLFLLNLLSINLVHILNIHFPAPLVGMLLFTALLKLEIIPISLIEGGCKLMLENMGLFFVPLLVGVVLYLNLIAKNALPIVLTIVISSALIICAVGYSSEYLINKRAK